MTDRPQTPGRPHSSRQLYREFVEKYKRRQLDDPADAGGGEVRPAEPAGADAAAKPDPGRGRRQYLRAYLRRLRPHRPAVIAITHQRVVACRAGRRYSSGSARCTGIAHDETPVERDGRRSRAARPTRGRPERHRPIRSASSAFTTP